jgi:hypothetical protein
MGSSVSKTSVLFLEEIQCAAKMEEVGLMPFVNRTRLRSNPSEQQWEKEPDTNSFSLRCFRSTRPLEDLHSAKALRQPPD